jgi:FkbM family methyltransferase
MQVNNEKTDLLSVVDVGCKFGLHPSFLDWRGFGRFLLIDADPIEISLLNQRYANDNSISLVSCFITSPDYEGAEQTLNLYRHPGGHSKFLPDVKDPYWVTSRPSSGEIVGSVSTKGITLDRLCREWEIFPDFIKIDVEGAESEVLAGSPYLLNSCVLGARIEVMFNSLYEGLPPSFGEIDRIMREREFVLLNYDQPTNARASFSQWYGQAPYGRLIGADAIYIKDPKVILQANNLLDIAKAAIFALSNGAADLGIYLLEHASRERSWNMTRVTIPKIVAALEKSIASHLFRIQDYPGRSLADFEVIWRQIFESEPIKYGDYYRRYPLS